jgi:hypothetical protein
MRTLVLTAMALLVAPGAAHATLVYRSEAGKVTVAHNDGSARHALATGREPSISPDGRRIAYLTRSACRCGAENLHVMSPRGRNRRTLARNVYSPGSRPLPLPWSPNSRRLAAASYYRFGGYLFDLKTRKRLFVASDFRFDGASFSPSSAEVIYEDSGGNCPANGRMVLFHIVRRTRRSLGCGEGVVWGARGFAFFRGTGIFFVRKPGQKPRRMLDNAAATLAPLAWSADGNRLLLIRDDPDGITLHPMFFDRRTGMAQTLDASFSSITAISRDGRSALGVSEGNVIAARGDGTTAVLARSASQPAWNH